MIADGFIAVQAQDAPTVKDIGQRVLAWPSGIGVGNSITPHAKAIIEAADKRRWENVRQELDRTQNSVQQAMNELQDQKLSELVSLGGWLRGTQVLTAVVSKQLLAGRRRTAASAGSAGSFSKRSWNRCRQRYNVPIVRQIRSALGEVKPLIDVERRKISATSVKKINEITARLDHGIVTRD